jgi:hypothetical protein
MQTGPPGRSQHRSVALSQQSSPQISPVSAEQQNCRFA